MFTKGVSAVYLSSTLIVCLKLQAEHLDQHWMALLLITLGAIIIQETIQTSRYYQQVSRPLASAGLVDGVVLVPMLLASLQPWVEHGSESLHQFSFQTCADLFWISLLNSMHFLTSGFISYKNDRVSSSQTLRLLSNLILDTVYILAVHCFSGVAFAALGLALFMFSTLHHTLLMKIQRSFTLGEASILSNAAVLLTYIAWDSSTKSVSFNIQSQHSIILLALILGSMLICFFTFPLLHSINSSTTIIKSVYYPVYFYGCMLVVIFGVVAPWFSWVAGKHPVIWMYNYVVADLNNLGLVIYWVACLVMLLPVIGYIQQYGVAMIILRKCFHLLGLVMFVPATAIAPRFLSVGYAVAFAALVIIEMIKYGDVPPCSSWFTRLMRRFVDSRDGGYFTVTHIYLLVGCATPLWIMSAVGLDDTLLASLHVSYAGLLILGMGDSAAAVVGTYYGRHKWPWPYGSPRSFEGSLASVTSVLASVFILSLLFHAPVNWVGLILAVGLASTLEALTDQIDNIVLPLHFMALLNVVLHPP